MGDQIRAAPTGANAFPKLTDRTAAYQTRATGYLAQGYRQHSGPNPTGRSNRPTRPNPPSHD